jgi:hypothetical protein
MTNTPKPPLDEEGVEPLPRRIRELPSAADRRTGRRMLVWAAMAAAAFALIVLLVTGVLAADAFRTSTAEQFHRLKGREISARFTGMEFTDEVHWALVFEKGARVSSFSMGKASTGSWRIDKDELCISLRPEEPRCYEVWTSGQRVELRSEPAMPDEGILRKPQKRQ